MRKSLLWAGLALILVVVNGLILHKENILANGTLVLLDLAPRDPRSLLQGDYMALRYRIAAAIETAMQQQTDRDSVAVITIDTNHVARLVRLHMPGETLAANEYLLHYRTRGGLVKVATDAFYFQEGHAHYYSMARYGRFRVSGSGEAVLTGLCDDKLLRLSAPGAATTVTCLEGR
jgi:uncharacterized membrane-anchored protein